MIRTTIAAITTALVAAAPAFADERGFPVGGFDRIAVGGSADVTVVTGRAAGVHASGDAAALDRLDIRVEGGVLKIGTKRDGWISGWRDHGSVRIAVTVPMVRAVDLSGSGSASVDRVKVRDFEGQINGSGRLTIAALDTDTAQFGISGSGDMTAAGRCNTGKASIAGSGDLKLAGLKCATFSGNIAGSGSIDAFATQTATLATMGSGDITVTGGARCTTSTAGSGKVRCS